MQQMTSRFTSPASSPTQRTQGIRDMIRRLHHIPQLGDRGSASLELAILAPGFLLVLVVLIFTGRVAMAQQSVHAAAADAARAASIARTQGTAAGDARSAADATLAAEGLRCSSTGVTVNTSGFTAPVGTPATVSATISCVVNLSDLAAPGIPGSRAVSATVVSALDTYRER